MNIQLLDLERIALAIVVVLGGIGFILIFLLLCIDSTLNRILKVLKEGNR